MNRRLSTEPLAKFQPQSQIAQVQDVALAVHVVRTRALCMLVLSILLFGEHEGVLQFFSSQHVDDLCHLNSAFFFIDTLIDPTLNCNPNAGQYTRYPAKSGDLEETVRAGVLRFGKRR